MKRLINNIRANNNIERLVKRRRGPIRHPEDGEELPEYDDKDVLPRYQDVEAGLVPGSTARLASGPGSDCGLRLCRTHTNSHRSSVRRRNPPRLHVR